MRFGTVVLAMALAAAPACGGGAGGSGGTGGSAPTVAAGFTAAQPSPGAGAVAMQEGSKANDIVTVNVTVTSVSGMFGAAFDVVYDAGHVSYLGYSNGAALESGGNTPIYTVSDSVTAGSGRVVVGAARTGGSVTTVTGTVKLIGLQFRVDAAGNFPVEIENASLYDNQASNPQSLAGITWFAGALSGI